MARPASPGARIPRDGGPLSTPAGPLGAPNDRAQLDQRPRPATWLVLKFITAPRERLGVNVPEADYAKVATVTGAHAYLQELSLAKRGRR